MKDFYEFANDLGERESGNNYACKNTLGYLGRWQFGKPRLWDLGLSVNGWKPRWWSLKRIKAYKVHTVSETEFRRNKDLQETIFRAHVRDLTSRIRKKYSKYYGVETYDIWEDYIPAPNVVLTESGMVAGAHLKGMGGLSEYLKGKDNTDAYGTKISEYIEKFAGYKL